MPPRELFLSHSSQDRIHATRLAENLRAHGISVWYSQLNIIGAQQWIDEIGRALRRCDWFLVLLSSNSVQSVWVRRELNYALTHNQYENHILPVNIEECDYEDLSWTLGGFQMIDLINNDRDEGMRQLLRTWGVGFDPDLCN